MTRKVGAHSLVAGAVALLLAGCSSGVLSKLPGAVYASHVPVYSPASFDGHMGGTNYGETPEETSEGQSWFFKTDRPMDQVLSFYEKSLPGWTRTEERDGDGPYVTFKHTPQGAEEGEYVEVVVRQGHVQIHESCRPGKIRS